MRIILKFGCSQPFPVRSRWAKLILIFPLQKVHFIDFSFIDLFIYLFLYFLLLTFPFLLTLLSQVSNNNEKWKTNVVSDCRILSLVSERRGVCIVLCVFGWSRGGVPNHSLLGIKST